jgi:hypothetical protein
LQKLHYLDANGSIVDKRIVMHACCGELGCLINSCLHSKHMCFGQELIKSLCSSSHRCCMCTDLTMTQSLPPYKTHAFQAQLFHCRVLSRHHVSGYSKNVDRYSSKCVSARSFACMLWREFQHLINSRLHRKHMSFGLGLIKHWCLQLHSSLQTSVGVSNHMFIVGWVLIHMMSNRQSMLWRVPTILQISAPYKSYGVWARIAWPSTLTTTSSSLSTLVLDHMVVEYRTTMSCVDEIWRRDAVPRLDNPANLSSIEILWCSGKICWVLASRHCVTPSSTELLYTLQGDGRLAELQ